MSDPFFDVSDSVNKITERCDALPQGWQLTIDFYLRTAVVRLYDPHGDEVELSPEDCCHVRNAIEAAQELAPDFVFEADRCDRCRGCGMVTEWVGNIPGDLEMNGTDCPDCGGTGKRKDAGR